MQLITLDQVWKKFETMLLDYSNWPLRVLYMFGEYTFGKFCDGLKKDGYIIY